MQVDRSRADRAAAGQRDPRLALARQQGAQHQHRGAHLAHDVVGRGGRGDPARLERQGGAVAVAVLAGGSLDLDAVLAQQRDHGGDVGQPRHFPGAAIHGADAGGPVAGEARGRRAEEFAVDHQRHHQHDSRPATNGGFPTASLSAHGDIDSPPGRRAGSGDTWPGRAPRLSDSPAAVRLATGRSCPRRADLQPSRRERPNGPPPECRLNARRGPARPRWSDLAPHRARGGRVPDRLRAAPPPPVGSSATRIRRLLRNSCASVASWPTTALHVFVAPQRS